MLREASVCACKRVRECKRWSLSAGHFVAGGFCVYASECVYVSLCLSLQVTLLREALWRAQLPLSLPHPLISSKPAYRYSQHTHTHTVRVSPLWKCAVAKFPTVDPCRVQSVDAVENLGCAGVRRVRRGGGNGQANRA